MAMAPFLCWPCFLVQAHPTIFETLAAFLYGLTLSRLHLLTVSSLAIPLGMISRHFGMVLPIVAALLNLHTAPMKPWLNSLLSSRQACPFGQTRSVPS